MKLVSADLIRSSDSLGAFGPDPLKANLGTANTFTGNQNVTGDVVASGTFKGSDFWALTAGTYAALNLETSAGVASFKTVNGTTYFDAKSADYQSFQPFRLRGEVIYLMTKVGGGGEITRAEISDLGMVVTGVLSATGAVTGSNLSGTNTGNETYSTITTKLAGGSGGGTVNFLRADGTFAAPPAGGGGTPAGATGQIQFNNAGAFGADADLSWDATTNDLVLGGTDTGMSMRGVTVEPATPATGLLHYYAKPYAGRMIPKVKGPSGLDTPMQAAIWGNNITTWASTNVTGGFWQGTIGTSAGTYTTQLPTTTSVYTSIKRGRYANVVTTLNQILGQRGNENMFWRGSVAEQGGFFFFARCGMDVWTNGGRFFAGMEQLGGATASQNPSTAANNIGFCVDSADNGAISFLTRNDTVATKAATGFTFASGKGYDLFIFAAPNGTDIGWRIKELNTGLEASGTATATLPVNTVMLHAAVLASNAALTPVTSVQLGINRIYIETDY